MRKAIFLDRDGVINQSVVINGKPHSPTNLAAMIILPGVQQALELLAQAGFLLTVITNQPNVARGITSQASIEEIHHYLLQHLRIDEIRCCYHDDKDTCTCRKPLPGALLAAAAAHDIDLASSYMVGDRWRDIEAGQQAGCKTIFIDYGYQEKQPSLMNHRVHTLEEAAQIIMGEIA